MIARKPYSNAENNTLMGMTPPPGTGQRAITDPDQDSPGCPLIKDHFKQSGQGRQYRIE
jgi:hypothetical protein